MPSFLTLLRQVNRTPSLRLACALLVVLSLAINVAGLIPVLFMLQVYDRVLASGNAATLLLLALITLAGLATGSLLEAMRGQAQVRLGNRIGLMLSLQLRRSRTRLTPNHAKDLATLRDTLTAPPLAHLTDALWLPAHLALCLVFHPLFGVVVLSGASLMLLLARWRHHGDQRLRQPARSAALRWHNAAPDSPSWQFDYRRWLQWHSRRAEHTANSLAIQHGLRTTLQSGGLALGAWLAIQGIITPGMMIAASILMSRTLQPVEQLMTAVPRLREAWQAWQRLSIADKPTFHETH